MERHEIILYVVSDEPVIVSVVRLAAGPVSAIGRVVAVRPDGMDGIVPSDGSVVVCDLDLERSTPVELGRLITRLPDARVVVLSERSEGSLVLEAMRLGAFAFIGKPEGLHDLPEVLSRVVEGERVLPPDLEGSAVTELRRFARRAHAASTVRSPVTDREQEILTMVAEGFTTHQIGRRLQISPRTVEVHIAKLYRKLGVKSRVQVVARGVALGLIDTG